MLCIFQLRILENIWFVWPKTSYRGDKWRWYRCGTTTREERTTQLLICETQSLPTCMNSLCIKINSRQGKHLQLIILNCLILCGIIWPWILLKDPDLPGKWWVQWLMMWMTWGLVLSVWIQVWADDRWQRSRPIKLDICLHFFMTLACQSTWYSEENSDELWQV